MAVLTTTQIMIVGAIGGLTVLAVLVLAIGIGLALHAVIPRATAAYAARRQRRQDLQACRAIDQLGTTNHPKEQRG